MHHFYRTGAKMNHLLLESAESSSACNMAVACVVVGSCLVKYVLFNLQFWHTEKMADS
jgi:hypothetical protein